MLGDVLSAPQQPQYPYYQPPQWQPPPHVDPSQLRPGRVWYWLSPIPLAIGIAVCVFFVVMLVDRLDFHLQHFAAGSAKVVHVEKGKQRGIYSQTGGSRVTVSGIGVVSACTVRAVGSEAAVPVHAVTTSFTLTLNNDIYDERFWFEPTSTGNYTVSCQGAEGTPLAIGPHLGFRGLALPIVGIVVAFLLGMALTIAIPVITAVRRGNHKKRIQAAILSGHPPRRRLGARLGRFLPQRSKWRSGMSAGSLYQYQVQGSLWKSCGGSLG